MLLRVLTVLSILVIVEGNLTAQQSESQKSSSTAAVPDAAPIQLTETTRSQNGSKMAPMAPSFVNRGDQIVIALTGELAQEYAKRAGGSVPAGAKIEALARVEQVLPGGNLRIEHILFKHGQDKPELVTLTATINGRNITADIEPAGTFISVSPDSKPIISASESRTLRTELSDRNSVKLRSWISNEDSEK